MGRGRAKAKQTKVARALKYTTTGTDLDRLRAELTTGDIPARVATEPDGEQDELDDEWADEDDEDD